MDIESVTQAIDLIASKLGVAAEKVYPMLLGQAEVFKSTYHLTIGIMVASVVLLIIGIMLLVISDSTDSEWCEMIGGFMSIIAGIAFMISGFITLCDYSTYMTAVHNPDWYAIETALKLLK